MNELQSNPKAMPEDRKKMLGILDRFEKQAIDQEQMMDMSEDEILRQLQHQQQTSAPVASSSTSSKSPGMMKTGTATTLTAKERGELLRKTIEEERRETEYDPAGAGGDDINPTIREEMQKVLDQEHEDLIRRFQDVDLDQESFEDIWARLNKDEKREFRDKFILASRMDDHNDDNDDDADSDRPAEVGVGGGTEADDDKEELEAKKLLEEMGETLRKGGETAGKSIDPMIADLDAEDLKAIRDAEISELISIWRPWWEVDAEESGQLKRVVVSEVTDDNATATAAAEAERFDSANSIPSSTAGFTASTSTSTAVLERVVLDEEAMLRPHRSLVQDVEEIKQREREDQLATSTGVLPMTKEPHPSLIYHVCALLFAYAATCRVLNGDLQDEREQALVYIFDLCPFFTPPPPSPTSLTPSITSPVVQVPDVDDFETTLAVIQNCSLSSNLWKGDTLRLEMLTLLLRDLTLLLAMPSRCLRAIRDLKSILASCISLTESGKTGAGKRPRLYSKSILHRLLKKLEFYESYFLSKEWMRNSDRIDDVRTEVVVKGIHVRQEMVGWTRELESVSRVQQINNGQSAPELASDIPNRKSEMVLIEELN
ncbi:hypothetical protein BGZ99_006074 [Dissophora globulifera]|uniref:Uncharacterized protein n=1 Tax=Dissophora globulifera TaxID=979702 RepID=A0A9P6RFX8_9FUNG|nr:hypothetical protein BGZ99_006074 [Dissophora globulifera]